MRDQLCDLEIHVNGQHTFFLHKKVVSRFCGKLSKIKNSTIEIQDFPGGVEGFELVSRFCYKNSHNFTITFANVSLLHCSAIFLGMTDKVHPNNLLQQTETFLESMFYWSWHEVIKTLKNCESFFMFADSCGLIQKLMNTLLAKIAQNSDVSLLFKSSPSSSSSSSDYSSSNKSWWFDDMTILPPKIIEQFLKTLGAFGNDNNNLLLTRFLLHYLKKTSQNNKISRIECSTLADTALHGVVIMGKSAFSCRSLFWVLRVVSGFGLSKEYKSRLEKLIGGVLDQATLDDLLICGHDGGAYDVNIVLRLIRLFVLDDDNDDDLTRMLKVGRLVDKYLREIAPDQSLKVSKFLGVAESLPDFARDCFDGVYRAIDIYLESHTTLSLEETSTLCRCLNYAKLSLEACKDLAKNPRIPPRISVQALASQGSNLPAITTEDPVKKKYVKKNKKIAKTMKAITYQEDQEEDISEHMRINLQRMQWKVVELEKVCREMKGQMSKMSTIVTPTHNTRPLPRLC